MHKSVKVITRLNDSVSHLLFNKLFCSSKHLSRQSYSCLYHGHMERKRWRQVYSNAALNCNSSNNVSGSHTSPHFIAVQRSHSFSHDTTDGSGIPSSTDSSAKDSHVQPQSRLFTPVIVKANNSSFNEGEVISGPIQKKDILKMLSKFYNDNQIRETAFESGLDEYLYREVYISFRQFCESSKVLPADLHIILSDIIQGAGHIHNIFPCFMEHAKKVFPHLLCMDDLCKVSDLTNPPFWYAEARSIRRKIKFHVGPTNSGKTYHAMLAFLNAASGVYCGPLKLLATEVYLKSNEKGTPCDLVTGEERRTARPDGLPANHVSCTAEMTSTLTNYDVGIIDEIQLLRDPSRGWAWTRAFLGMCAKEVHLCGEAAAIPLVEQLVESTGDVLEVIRYNRLTELTIEDKALGSLSAVQPGDCIVCFSKRDILEVSRTIERLGHQVAVIYGGLPPGTKIAQAKKFNDPNHPCKIMVATDAIGMGINLSIRRVIFNSVYKVNTDEKGEKEMGLLTVSQALQIAGRAGRYGTQWEHGYVTCMHEGDLPQLKQLLNSVPEEITQAGLHPTADQIELFAYHLPNYTLSSLIDIFVNICTVNKSLYFMCSLKDFKFLADLIQHIDLPLRSRYVFCCSPINKRLTFVCAIFLKYVRQFSQGRAATVPWLCEQVDWPVSPPVTVADLVRLEQIFDVFDLYLWLSYRFSDMFPDPEEVRALQASLDSIIQEGVNRITELKLQSQPIRDEEPTDEEYGPSSLLPKMPAVQPAKTNERQRRKSLYLSHEEEAVQQKSEATKRSLKKLGNGRLADHLIATGMLTEDVMAQLHEEWKLALKQEKNSDGKKNRR